MKRGILVLVAFGCLTLGTSTAFAQDTSEVRTEGGQRTQSFNFEDELVSGQLVRPDGDATRIRRRNSVNSLIRIRQHFVPEMLKSVENL